MDEGGMRTGGCRARPRPDRIDRTAGLTRRAARDRVCSGSLLRCNQSPTARSSMARHASSSPGRPSIYDVALRAGVSHMTVSRVINDHPNIKESTREHVKHVIAELGY